MAKRRTSSRHARRLVATTVAIALAFGVLITASTRSDAATGIPSAPRTPKVDPGNASATVSWTPPKNDGGAAITNYVVTGIVKSTGATVATRTTDALGLSFTGLKNGTKYTFKIAAVNTYGTGPTASTTVVTAGLPGTVATPAATVTGSSAIVSWTAPASNGSAITAYRINRYLNGKGAGSTLFNSPTTTQAFSNLPIGSYAFTVTAKNGVGFGKVSSKSNVVAVEPPPPSDAGTTVGNAAYPVPANAIVVSPSGSDGAQGTQAAPLRTLARAITIAPSGATVVLRSGTYPEAVIVPATKRLTIQSWPLEAVWLEGSNVLTGWVQDGTLWRYDNWKYEFEKTPTETPGAPDNTEEGWKYLDPAYPLASYPDQLWIDGIAQRQKGSRAAVTAGTFFHDEAANRLYVGSDPTGQEVRASARQQAIRIKSNGSIVRGIGIRRYAPSVPDFGALLIDQAPNVLIEHVAIIDGATVGMGVNATGAIVRNVVLARHGMIGMRASKADRLVIDHVLVEDNNTENFNTAPVAGGIKMSKTRTVTLHDNVFRNNNGTGLWFDMSNYNMTITGNEFRNNKKHGAFLEISAKAVFANNLVVDNDGWGVKINNTDLTEVWNNTFIGNNGSIWIVQDDRRPSNFPAGRDSRRPYPDSTMTWIIRSALVTNNVMANQVGSQTCMLCVQDTERIRTAEQMGVASNSSVYNRPSSTASERLVMWSRGLASAAYYSTLPPFRSDTDQEASGRQVDGPAVVTSNGETTAAMPSMSSAQPLPEYVAVAVAKAPGERRFGAWPR